MTWSAYVTHADEANRVSSADDSFTFRKRSTHMDNRRVGVTSARLPCPAVPWIGFTFTVLDSESYVDVRAEAILRTVGHPTRHEIKTWRAYPSDIGRAYHVTATATAADTIQWVVYVHSTRGTVRVDNLSARPMLVAWPSWRPSQPTNAELGAMGFNLVHVRPQLGFRPGDEHIPEGARGFVQFEPQAWSERGNDPFRACAEYLHDSLARDNITHVLLPDEFTTRQRGGIDQLRAYAAAFKREFPHLKIWASENADPGDPLGFARWTSALREVAPHVCSKTWYGVTDEWAGSEADTTLAGTVRFARLGAGARMFWMTLQAFGWTAEGTGKVGPVPAPAELVWQLRSALEGGASGVCWFGLHVPHTHEFRTSVAAANGMLRPPLAT